MQTKETQSKITPESALQMLKEGNERFINNKMMQRDLMDEVKKTSNIQFPYASVLACIDSRMLPEIFFDQGIGDVFIVRVAGNIVNNDILGSLEFASKIIGSRLILVMGHTDCGAMKGAINDVKMGHLTGVMEKIKPAVEALSDYDGEKTASNIDFVTKVNEKSIRMTIEKIREESDILREMEEKGEIIISGAMYDNETGKVTFFDSTTN